ncbi:MAG: SusC/RagA family TonB-linked outer membrane protein [Chryseolinea sp.]
MRKHYHTGSSWRFCFLVMVVSLSLEAAGQDYARAGTTPRRSVNNPSSAASEVSLVRHSQNVSDATLSLKQALNRIRETYNVKFAYREGLLDGMRVPSALLSSKSDSSVEALLESLLTGSNLTFKRINKKQFSIFLDSKSARQSNVVPMSEAAAGEVVAHSNATEQIISFDIAGTVTSEDDAQPIPGVNVLLKGTTTGTTTDADGKFVLKLPDGGGTLVFSFIGYATKEVPVTNESSISVTLSQEAKSLNEVVVTAFGIAKEKKGLVYSVTEVKGSEFTQARETNVANALIGKIAGVNASGMATGPGGSSRIVIRGNGSLGGSNQPLYVINGMPMDNSVPGGATESTGNGNNVDRGDGIGGINPDDIESISVLKGGPAAALYGARASNGVILITTKKGRAQKGIGVEINSNFTAEDIAVIPEWQYEYGQGVDGVKPTTQTQAKSSGRLSYGAKMDGEPYVQFDGQSRPYSPQKDNLKNFYRTGTNFTNSIAFTGGNENVNFRFGLNDTHSNSIVPNSSFDRKIANLNLNARLGKRLSFETVVQYNLEEGTNRPKVGYADMNPHWATYLVANTVDIRSLSPGYDPVTMKEVEWNPVPAAPNPYFVVNKFKNNDLKNRFLGQANVRLDLTDKLFLKGSVSRDYYGFKSQFVQPTGNAYAPLGTYEERDVTSSETNGMLTLNYSTQFARTFSVTALLGGNMQRNVYDQIAINGSEFTVPYFYSYTNLATMTTTPTYYKTAINSVFGSVDLSYKGFLYLTMSGRQDWFSVLNPKSNSIFYPAVGGTFVMSDAIHFPRAVSFAKLRASWAQVGGANVGAYQTYQTYSMVQGGHNGRPVQQLGSATVPNPDLRPLTSTTYEAGLEAGFFSNRLTFDLTVYHRKTTQDIVQSNIATSSGYTSAVLNVGELSNKGIELLVSGTPVRRSDFSWDVSYNVAYNKSEILQLAEGITSLTVGDGVGGGTIRNVIGGTYGEVWGYRKQTDANGNVVFNTASGYAVRGPLERIGNGVPPLTMGITNNFRYNNFSLNILIDGKFGSVVYSNLYQYAYRFGLPKETLPGRETGITVTGVTSAGDAYSKTWTMQEVDTYYDNDKNYTSMFVFNNDFVKLRQVVLTYNVPIERINALKWAQSLSISAVARNLAILYKDSKNDYFDPESGYTNGNAQGLEAFGVPRTKSIGVNLNLKF